MGFISSFGVLALGALAFWAYASLRNERGMMCPYCHVRATTGANGLLDEELIEEWTEETGFTRMRYETWAYTHRADDCGKTFKKIKEVSKRRGSTI